MGAFGYVACCFALFTFCTADLVPEGRNDVVTPFADHAVRLVGGPDHTKGRFELFINDVWGTVCDAGFSDIDAEVACVSLGFDQGRGNFLRDRFGPGFGVIHFSDVDCVGSELAIDDCSHSPLADVGDCTHDNDVSISCVGDGGYPVRLVGGIEPYEGRLEIQYQGVWGTVCDDFFTVLEAQVACNSLGFGHIGYALDNIFGEATGPINLDDVKCTGDETNIGYCEHNPWRSHNCGHSEDVALSCSNPADLVPEGRNDVVTPFADYAVRLVNGFDHTEGRFELSINGVWGTVCDAGFSERDAEVACVSLGFDQGRGNFLRNRFGPGTGAIHFSEVDCVGSELAIDDCSHSPAVDCTHDDDVSISCVGDGGYPVRLVGGLEPHEGRLEIQYQGIWGTVCNDYFYGAAVFVACNSLGYGYQGYVITNTFGETTGPMHLDDVECTGDETNIGYCAHDPWGVNGCEPNEAVAIRCDNLGYPVRLVGGFEPYEGRLEIQYQGIWGTVCNDYFTDLDVQVACISLGFGNQGNVIDYTFGESTGPIHLDDVQCTGDETNIGYCSHAPWGEHNCAHSEDVAISCWTLVV